MDKFDEQDEVSGEEAVVATDDLASDLEGELPWMEDEPAEASAPETNLEGTELADYQSAAIVEEEQIPEERIVSILESMLFATDRPQSVAMFKQAFKGTNVRSHHIRRAIDQLQIEYASAQRGVFIEEVAGGYQLRTKLDNVEFLKRSVKPKAFRLSGPALEVLSIVAYKQPVIKSQIDEIRGVESGHLLRALMEKSLVHFAGKSELPGKPMLYGTTRRFLEIFGLRNLQELPSLNDIDELIPDGIGDEADKETLGSVGDQLAQEVGVSYSTGEDELLKINEDLAKVETTTAFFEEEKRRMKEERDQQRAKDLLEALAVGEAIAEADQKWLEKYQANQASASVLPEESSLEPSVPSPTP